MSPFVMDKNGEGSGDQLTPISAGATAGGDLVFC